MSEKTPVPPGQIMASDLARFAAFELGADILILITASGVNGGLREVGVAIHCDKRDIGKVPVLVLEAAEKIADSILGPDVPENSN